MRHSDGSIITALDIDRQIAGFTTFSFVKDASGNPLIRCEKLISTKSGVKGIFSYNQYNHVLRQTELVRFIGSFSGTQYVDLDGEETVGGMSLLFESFVHSNSLTVTSVTGAEGTIYLNSVQRIAIEHSSAVQQILVGVANENTLGVQLVTNYIQKDENGNKLYDFVQPPIDFLEKPRGLQNFVTLSQTGRDNGGIVYGFQAQGDTDGIR